VKGRWKHADLALRIVCGLGLVGIAVLVALGFARMQGPSGEVVANPVLATSTWLVGSPPMQNVLVLETAVTPEQQRRGLMARDDVGPHDGMAFPYGGRQASFWMRGTRIPLDIAYVDPAGRVSRVVTGRPFDDTHLAGGPSSVVIEVRAGRARLLGLVPGARVVRADPATDGRGGTTR
jgi:uncharacterized membrane protein (UPF0127 family)